MIRYASKEEISKQYAREKTSVVYDDDLSIRQIGHLESVF